MQTELTLARPSLQIDNEPHQILQKNPKQNKKLGIVIKNVHLVYGCQAHYHSLPFSAMCVGSNVSFLRVVLILDRLFVLSAVRMFSRLL